MIHVRLILEIWRHELVPRDLAHGFHHVGILDTSTHDLILDHRLAVVAESIALRLKDHRLARHQEET